jgi:hypothetical protein
MQVRTRNGKEQHVLGLEATGAGGGERWWRERGQAQVPADAHAVFTLSESGVDSSCPPLGSMHVGRGRCCRYKQGIRVSRRVAAAECAAPHDGSSVHHATASLVAAEDPRGVDALLAVASGDVFQVLPSLLDGSYSLLVGRSSRKTSFLSPLSNAVRRGGTLASHFLPTVARL